jgi:rubrerythrin
MKVPQGKDLDQHIAMRIADEKKAIKLLHDSIRKTDNPVIRLLLSQLAFDSAKHEYMLKIVLELLKTSPETGIEAKDADFREVMKTHIKVERAMIKGFEQVVDRIKDRRIRFILQDIISDEKRHHAITKRIYDLACEGEATRDDAWWDFLFRYSRLSG